jgi:hypothetical protein
VFVAHLSLAFFGFPFASAAAHLSRIAIGMEYSKSFGHGFCVIYIGHINEGGNYFHMQHARTALEYCTVSAKGIR